MSTSKRKSKVRRDAKLKDLPEPQRALIAGWVKEDGWQSCLQRLSAELGISAGRTALYEALAFWESEAEFNGYEATARAMASLEAQKAGGMSLEKMEEATDRYFVMIAAQKKDADLYKELRFLRIADQSAKTRARQKDAEMEQRRASLNLEVEKFKATIRTKLETGLDALFSEIKGNAKAEALFAQLREVVARA